MELDSTEAIISGVEAELGVGFVSRCAVNKVLRLGSVKIVGVEGLEILRDFSFVRLAGTEADGDGCGVSAVCDGEFCLASDTKYGAPASAPSTGSGQDDDVKRVRQIFEWGDK